MSSGIRHSLWIESPGNVHVIESDIPSPQRNQVLVQSVCSAISAGTELLAYKGLLPKGLVLDESLAGMGNDVKYPLKYGYSIVGSVVDVGPGVDKMWLDKIVFAFSPHESHFLASQDAIVSIPEFLHFEDAVFLANMETAVSIVMDGAPLVGEKVLVMGLGIVGQLLSSVLQQFPLSKLVVVDPIRKRRLAMRDEGTIDIRKLERANIEGGDGYDLVYETSGSPEALKEAINLTRYHGRVIVSSWYGSKNVSLDLGSHFHRSKVSLYASQVSRIDPSLAGRWDKKRRMNVALNMLKKVSPRSLITHQYSIKKAADAYLMLARGQESIQSIITY